MKVRQAQTQCSKCATEFMVLEYVEIDRHGWTLFSDGYLYHPNDASPWHRLKICPGCQAAIEIDESKLPDLEKGRVLPSGDDRSPRDRVRAHLDTVPPGHPKRSELLLMDLWVSNHIEAQGRDSRTTRAMEELLDLDNALESVLRADILRQLGRFHEARERLLALQENLSPDDTVKRRHVRSILSLISQSVKGALPVASDPAHLPPTGRLAIRQVANRL